MTAYKYCTPEWLEESTRIYRETSKFEQQLEKVTTKVFYRIKAEPAWGIEEDILFGAVVNRGKLEELAFFSEEAAEEAADFIMAATPQEWKKILRKESKFLTDFMLGKITLERGSKVGVLGLAPYANTFIDALTQVDLRFPDELTAEELDRYRAYVEAFRARLGV
jgi:putative sterol carrier protein